MPPASASLVLELQGYTNMSDLSYLKERKIYRIKFFLINSCFPDCPDTGCIWHHNGDYLLLAFVILYTVHFSITYNSNQCRVKVLSNGMQTSPAIHTYRYVFTYSERHENTNGGRKAWEVLGYKPEILRSLTGTGRTPMRGGSTELKRYILWYFKEYEIFSEVRFLALKHLKVSHENVIEYTDRRHLGESPGGHKERQHE